MPPALRKRAAKSASQSKTKKPAPKGRTTTGKKPAGKRISIAKKDKPAGFPQFSRLPTEIRQKIWHHALPDPRVLLVVRSNVPKWYGTYTTVPSSYGGNHPAILSVCHESRAEALRFLTPLFGTYWNLAIDAPYFEIKSNDDDGVTLLAEMSKKGKLKDFRNIAIDWMFCDWKEATHTMEFRTTFGNRFSGYEHPIQTLNGLKNIEKCTFVYTDHTLQHDLVTPYKPWYLGPLTAKNSLSDKEELEERTKLMKRRVRESRKELKRRVSIDYCGIEGRTRSYLPPEQLRRPQQGWEMDWFG